MALTSDQLAQAAELVTAAPTLRAAARQLRERFAGVSASVVDAMDLRGETPAWQQGPRAIYLAANEGHCWSVTSDPERASAFVLAES